MKDKSTIPAHWQVKKLGEVLNFIGGGTPDKSNRDYWNGNIPWASVKDIKGKYLTLTKDKISEAGLSNSSAQLAMPGEIILVTRISPGKTAIAKISSAINQDLKIIKPKIQTITLFIHYLFETLQKEIIKKSSGTTVLGIRLETLKEIEVSFPPLSEQQEIVTKIEELLSELDKGKEQLETARQQLKVYRQAVLKWAFEVDKDIYKSDPLSAVSEKIQIGPFGTQLHKEDYIEGGIPLINPMHIVAGVIKADSSYSISVEKRDSLPNYIIQEGDVIMGRRGEMGRCGLVTAKENGWFCGTGSLYVRPNKAIVTPEFLYYYLSNETVKKYLEENAGGTTMANLNLKIVNNIPIHLPSVEEQQQIVQEIESRLSVCDKVEETITQSLQQAETLRRSILKQAFEGKLLKAEFKSLAEGFHQLEPTTEKAGQYQITFS